MGVPSAVAAFLFKTTAASPQDSSSNPLRDIIGTRVSSSRSDLYIDGIFTNRNSNTDTGSLPSFKPAFGAYADSNSSATGFISFREQVSFWGSSLSSTDVANIRSRVQALNTALGR